MSDAVEKTAAGATRGFFGALGFILLMLGLEGMTGAAEIRFGLGLFLTLLGALCCYAAFFWESAKRVLSLEAQATIGRFAQSRITWLAMIFLVIEALILSRFVEERRWPFSYPTDPTIFSENAKLKNDLSSANSAFTLEKVSADKWRFSSILRLGMACGYQMQITSKAAHTAGFWQELLQHGGWNEKAGAIALAPAPGSIASGITIRINGNAGISTQCAGVLQRALTDIYPNPPSKVAANQQSDFLSSCPDCVQIEIDY
jgi:hypothetical protein